jgi:RsmE family RNA methyltransferase
MKIDHNNGQRILPNTSPQSRGGGARHKGSTTTVEQRKRQSLEFSGSRRIMPFLVFKIGMIFFLSSRIRYGLSFTTRQRLPRMSYFHSSTLCRLNRFLFDSSELVDNMDGNQSTSRTVILPSDDYRTIHAAKILGLRNGDTVRAGVVSCDEHGGLLTDQAAIEWIPEGKVKKPEPLKNGEPPGSISFRLDNLTAPAPSSQVTVSLILALPRPLQLGRILPMISQMGVDHLVLTGAGKVPKDYFGSHLFRKPEALQERLIEGLCQAGDVRLPKLHIVKNLAGFLENDLDTLFPVDSYARVIAHPQRLSDTGEPTRMGQIKFPASSQPPRVVVAVGPEGGWEEPEELERFQQHGFQQITLGNRILRSDCAVVSLLSLANDVCVERLKTI